MFQCNFIIILASHIMNLNKKSNMEFTKFLCLTGTAATMLLTGCTQKNVILEGKVTNTSGAPIIYNITTDGIYLPNRVDTLHLKPDSTYQVTLPVNGNEKLSLFLYGKRNLGSIYLVPGKQTLDIDASKSNELNPVDGLTKENEILKKLVDLNENVFNLRARRGDIFNVSKDTVASSVYQKLTDYATTLEKEVTGVDDLFRQRVIQDIRIQALMAYMNQYFGNYRRGSETTRKEWNEAYAQMLDFANIDQSESVFSPAFADVVSNMAGIDIFMKNERRTNDDNERNQLLFDWYKANLQGRGQEAAMGLLILEDESRENFATGTPALYEEFKTLYPQSVLMPKLETAIQKNKAFNETELPKDIHILNTDSVRTFKEITDLYPGKVIFIDVWATWCGPCRASFAHIKPLQKYAAENDIVLLYVSIDTPQKAELWKKMAGHYNLKGEHAIINETFKMEIYEKFGRNGILSIPHYAIVNKKGELQFPSAASPEDMDKLTEQLKEASE